jgi:hypothetical protein
LINLYDDREGSNSGLFIDESGQTRDIARLNTVSGFNKQPIFCLAAVGVADETSLEREANRLREKHGIRIDERDFSVIVSPENPAEEGSGFIERLVRRLNVMPPPSVPLAQTVLAETPSMPRSPDKLAPRSEMCRTNR